MKTKSYKALLALVLAAVMLFAVGCAGNGGAGQAGTGTDGTAQAADSEAAPEQDAQPAGPEPAGAEPAEQEPAGPAMDIDQYVQMAKEFAFYCDSVYFDYQFERGTVTILDTRVDEDTESQCRITVYYQEPELTDDPNSYVAPTDGYMTFVIDKATAQGKMECWNFLGEPGAYLDEEVDQMDVAIFHSGFVYSVDDVYDFATGTILYAAVEETADVTEYWDQNSLGS